VGPDVTIIIISAYDWQSIEAEARAAGANLMISKPLLKSTLVSAFRAGAGRASRTRRRSAGNSTSPASASCGGGQRPQRRDRQDACWRTSISPWTVAPNGLKALEMFVQSPVGYYDAILMDVRMPMMDGLQATVNIRHWDKADARTIPIIAMTANAFDEDVEKSRAAGMNAHLSKPIRPGAWRSPPCRPPRSSIAFSCCSVLS
jgi:two-component system sensor histidine kinase/response regulator